MYTGVIYTFIGLHVIMLTRGILKQKNNSK